MCICRHTYEYTWGSLNSLSDPKFRCWTGSWAQCLKGSSICWVGFQHIKLSVFWLLHAVCDGAHFDSPPTKEQPHFGFVVQSSKGCPSIWGQLTACSLTWASDSYDAPHCGNPMDLPTIKNPTHTHTHTLSEFEVFSFGIG
jgi:hypothetical protein